MQYYVSTTTDNPGKNHEVHREICRDLPLRENRIYLGDFSLSSTALTLARQRYADADGCIICSPEIHHE